MAILMMESFQTTSNPADTKTFNGKAYSSRCSYKEGGRDGFSKARIAFSEGERSLVENDTSGGLYMGFRFWKSGCYHGGNLNYVPALRIGNSNGYCRLTINRALNLMFADSTFEVDANCFVEIGMDENYQEIRINNKTMKRVEHELGAPTKCSTYARYASSSSGCIAMQDFYLNNKAGSANNSFLGDVKINAYKVNSDVENNGFTSSAGGALFEDVNEWPVNMEDYIEGVNIGSSYLLGVEDVDSTDTPLCVRVASHAAKMAATDTGFKLLAKIGDTTVKSDKLTLAVEGGSVVDMLMNNSPDGASWTAAKVNSLNIGAEIVE